MPVPEEALLDPILVPLSVLARLHEKLELHLFEFSRTIREVAGGDLVAERFADLRNTEGKPATGGIEHVLEIHEDALCGLGSQPHASSIFLDRTDERLKHKIELPRLG